LEDPFAWVSQASFTGSFSYLGHDLETWEYTVRKKREKIWKEKEKEKAKEKEKEEEKEKEKRKNEQTFAWVFQASFTGSFSYLGHKLETWEYTV
jgi:high-affinity Fe2+/Pb2+ permease